MEAKRKANYDYLTAVISIAFGVIYGLMAYAIPRSRIGNPIAPSVFPLILAGGMIVFGLILLFKSNIQDLKIAIQKDKDNQDEHVKKRSQMIWVSCISILIYALTFEHLGYVLSTFVFMMINLANTERDKWARNTLVAVIFSVVVYYLFFYVLGISLPMTPIINI